MNEKITITVWYQIDFTRPRKEILLVDVDSDEFWDLSNLERNKLCFEAVRDEVPGAHHKSVSWGWDWELQKASLLEAWEHANGSAPANSTILA